MNETVMVEGLQCPSCKKNHYSLLLDKRRRARCNEGCRKRFYLSKYGKVIFPVHREFCSCGLEVLHVPENKLYGSEEYACAVCLMNEDSSFREEERNYLEAYLKRKNKS